MYQINRFVADDHNNILFWNKSWRIIIEIREQTVDSWNRLLCFILTCAKVWFGFQLVGQYFNFLLVTCNNTLKVRSELKIMRGITDNYGAFPVIRWLWQEGLVGLIILFAQQALGFVFVYGLVRHPVLGVDSTASKCVILKTRNNCKLWLCFDQLQDPWRSLLPLTLNFPSIVRY